MGDREPRRRKKRKDSSKKDDHHSEAAPTMISHKSESMDSDPDVEEEILIPPSASHQPSKLAQLVFMLIFLALAGLLGSLFIALHGSKSQIDIFNGEEHAEPNLSIEIDHVYSHDDGEDHEDSEHLVEHEDEEEQDLIDIFPDIMKHFHLSDSESTLEITNEEKNIEPSKIIENGINMVEIEENDVDNIIEDKLVLLDDEPGDKSSITIEKSILPNIEEKLTHSDEVEKSSLINSEPVSSIIDDKKLQSIEQNFIEENTVINEISSQEPQQKSPVIEELLPHLKEELSPPIIELKHSSSPEEMLPPVVAEKTSFIVEEKEHVEEKLSRIEQDQINKEISKSKETSDDDDEIEENETPLVKETIPHEPVIDVLPPTNEDDLPPTNEDDLPPANEDDLPPTNEDDLPPITKVNPPVVDVLPPVTKNIPIVEDVFPPAIKDTVPILEDEEINEKFSEQMYENADITNDEDYLIRHELDDIEKALEKFPRRALKKFEDLLKNHPTSPRILYGRARALDLIAEAERNNKFLEDAISAYQKVLANINTPETLYLKAGIRCAERMQFRGFIGKSILLLQQMATRFPKNIDIKNRIAVSYLLIGKNKEAKDVFTKTLKIAPNNGFAKAHLGFILKTDEADYENAIRLMSEGIQSKEPGVIDGRFYLHLGDALARTGHNTEAMKIYEEGVKEGLFMSVYQRSLYNVKGLTAKPWWDPFTMTYAPFFKILEKHWVTIKDEALSIINKKISVFADEREGLQDTGDWKQFDLFARGTKIGKNCALASFTCSLIMQMPDASKCKRGQVKFSIMRPGTHVWAHNGPTNCRLRAHLGLVVPSGTSMRVANETRTWNEGKILVFDDSFEHEVWHNGTSDRLVLIVDFWHPELTDRQRASLSPI